MGSQGSPDNGEKKTEGPITEEQRQALFATYEGMSPEQLTEYYLLQAKPRQREIIQEFIIRQSRKSPDYLMRIRDYLDTDPKLLERWNFLRSGPGLEDKTQ